MDKKTRQVIRKQIEDEVSGLAERLIGIFVFVDILKEVGERTLTEEDFGKYLTGDLRHIQKLEETFKDSHFYGDQYIKLSKNVVLNDRLYEYGLLDKFQNLLSSTSKYVKGVITPLANEYRYKQLKNLEEDGLVNSITMTALKLETYGICDDLNDEWGERLTRYCTDNDNVIIAELLEEEFKTKSSNNSLNVKEHLSLQELSLIREKVKNNQKFKIYRGFIINETDRVRRGRKEDGDLYHMQDAGTGLSYTLDKDVAYFFAVNKICGDYVSAKYQDNYILRQKQTNLIPNDKFIDIKTEEVSYLRDERQLKPIICEYECDPTQLRGYITDNSEAEVIIRPEDLRVIHYDIPHSRTMVEGYWEWLNRSPKAPLFLKYGAIANGLTAFFNVEGQDCGYVYAETEVVRDILEELLVCGDSPNAYTIEKAYNVFMHNSVVIPDNISPYVFGDGLYEYMRNPTNIVRKKNTKYLKNANKTDKLANKKVKTKGFS